MKKNFWSQLKKPFYCLAPMAGVTDSPFRQICKEFGADVVYSEMASAAALFFKPEATLEMLQFDSKERPYVVQLFGSKPEHFVVATKLIAKKIKPDGIDINFGCPVRKVQKQGAGATLMGDLKLAKKIVQTVVENTSLPVSVKCRTSVPDGKGGAVSVLDFLDTLQGLDVQAVMIHGRTMAQGHVGPVNYQIIKEARQHFSGIIIANGGVKDVASAQELLEKTGADGIGVGQGAMGKPWLFKQLRITRFDREARRANYELRKEEIFKLALKHAKLMQKLKGAAGIVEMRKHLCWYVAGLPGAAELRRDLVKVNSAQEIRDILRRWR